MSKKSDKGDADVPCEFRDPPKAHAPAPDHASCRNCGVRLEHGEPVPDARYRLRDSRRGG